MKKQQGFTLIELLVVVAIIGILATVVLASLGSARSRARDAAAKAALSQMRAEMELEATNADGNGYRQGNSGTACRTSASSTFITEVGEQVPGSAVCAANAGQYAASATLNDSTIFCVDSTGFAGTATAMIAASATSPVCTPA